jgi:hypothetical protein
MLFLLKSANNNEYLQENLQILAVSPGETSTIQYATRWVHPDAWGTVQIDEPVCLVLGERPYTRFVPVRRGNVTKVTDEAGDLTVTVAWGAFVQDPDVSAFSEHFSALNQNHYFVVRDPATSLDFVPEGEDDRAAWHAIAQALRVPPTPNGPGRYARSLFLRPLPPVDSDERVLSLDAFLHVGETYQQRIEYDAPRVRDEDSSPHRILLEPREPNVKIPDSLRVPEPRAGTLSFRVHPTDIGDVTINLWATPDRALSTTLRLAYQAVQPAEEESVPVPVPVSSSPPPLEVEVPEGDLRAIFDVIEEEEDDRNRAVLGLIDQTLRPLAPTSHYLQEQRGLVLYRLEQWKEAYDQFAALDPDRLRPRSIVAWFVSACRAGIDTDFEAILEHFDAWEQQSLTDQLIDVLPMVSEKRRLRLLQDAWLGAGRYRDVWQSVRSTFSQPEHILAVARLMVDPELYDLLSPAQGYTYLREQMPLGDMSLEMLEQTVEWGMEERDSNLGEAVLGLVDRLLRQGEEPWKVWNLVEEARDLSPHIWVVAAEKLAEALRRHADAEWRKEACKLYVDLARTQREQLQNLDAAGDYLLQAHPLVGNDDDLAQIVDAEEEEWQAVVTRLESVQKWHEGLTEVRRQRLREELSGKRAVFVGGLEKGFDVENIRRELGLAEADFIPHFRSERGSLDKVRDKIHQGKVDYVIDFISLGAHRNLDGDCESADVTYVRVRRSRSLNQIVRALAKAHDIELN